VIDGSIRAARHAGTEQAIADTPASSAERLREKLCPCAVRRELVAG
jgi:hypothetical protein